jgi:hypothetical protein
VVPNPSPDTGVGSGFEEDLPFPTDESQLYISGRDPSVPLARAVDLAQQSEAVQAPIVRPAVGRQTGEQGTDRKEEKENKDAREEKIVHEGVQPFDSGRSSFVIGSHRLSGDGGPVMSGMVNQHPVFLYTSEDFLMRCRMQYERFDNDEVYGTFYVINHKYQDGTYRKIIARQIYDNFVYIDGMDCYNVGYEGNQNRTTQIFHHNTGNIGILRAHSKAVVYFALGSKNQFNISFLANKLFNEIIRSYGMPWPGLYLDCISFICDLEFANMVKECEEQNLRRRPIVRATLWLRQRIMGGQDQWWVQFLWWYHEMHIFVWLASYFFFFLWGIANWYVGDVGLWLFYTMCAIGTLLFYRAASLGEDPLYTPASVIQVVKSCSFGVELPDQLPGVKLKCPHWYGEPCEKKKKIDVFGTIVRNFSCVIPQGCVHDLYNGLRIRMVFDRTYDDLVVARFVIFAMAFFASVLTKPFKLIPHEVWFKGLKGSRRRRLTEDFDEDLRGDFWIYNIFNKMEVYVGKVAE